MKIINLNRQIHPLYKRFDDENYRLVSFEGFLFISFNEALIKVIFGVSLPTPIHLIPQ